MTDPLSRWANDEQGPPLEEWTANRLYARALDANITDPRVVASAVALLDAAEKLSMRHPQIPFDMICDATLAGLNDDITIYWNYRAVVNYWKRRWLRWWRRVWQSIYGRIRKQPKKLW